MEEAKAWSPALENLVREFGTKANLWSILHADSQRSNDKRNNIVAILQIILNALSSLGLLILTTQPGFALALSTMLVQVISTILSAVAAFMQWAQLAAEHGKAQEIAASLSEEIEVQLALPRDKRLEAQEFIANTRTTMDSIRNKPVVEDNIMSKYAKMFTSSAAAPTPTPPASPPSSPSPPDEPASLQLFSAPERVEQRANRERLAEFHNMQLARLNTFLQAKSSSS